MNRITYRQWQNELENNLFYADLRATIDGVESGVIQQPFVDQWLAHQGYRLDWTNYDLEKLPLH